MSCQGSRLTVPRRQARAHYVRGVAANADGVSAREASYEGTGWCVQTRESLRPHFIPHFIWDGSEIKMPKKQMVP